MQINVTKSNGLVRARLQDSLDISSVSEARDHLLQILRSGSEILFDFSSMTEIDTAGVQLLVALRKEAQRSGVACRCSRPSPAVLDVFHVLGRDDIFDEAIVTA